MKIAVYAIMKNESKAFFERFLYSCKDADYIVISDTGTEYKSHLERVTAHGASFDRGYRIHNIHISPWRFDHARNVSLGLVPADADICICLDIDEVLTPGWRKRIEAIMTLHPETTRIRYPYIWSWNEDGSPGVSYHADKIHIRSGYQWKNPVHEVLKYDGAEVQTFINGDPIITHHPDNTKSRSGYLPLMVKAIEESPNDDRMRHYYARELMFYGRYGEAVDQFCHHINMPEAKWDSERAASYRYLGDCNWALGAKDLAIKNFHSAANLCPNEREPWVALAQAYRANADWLNCKIACEKALAIKERPSSYINSAVAWSDWPQQMLDEAIEQLNLLNKNK